MTMKIVNGVKTVNNIEIYQIKANIQDCAKHIPLILIAIMEPSDTRDSGGLVENTIITG